jgi:hypothetical protein
MGAAGSGAGDNMKGEPGARATERVRIDLGGMGFGNGAFIETTGDTAVVFITGVDTADDLVKIFAAVRETGATKGTLFTGPVTSPTDLIRYHRLAGVGGSRFGGKVSQLGEDTFRLDFDEWPIFE